MAPRCEHLRVTEPEEKKGYLICLDCGRLLSPGEAARRRAPPPGYA